jgi:hypothetical protein
MAVRRPSSTRECWSTSFTATPTPVCAYENDRRAATADVIAANREMHQSGATLSPEDLAEVTAKYRSDTDADRTTA